MDETQIMSATVAALSDDELVSALVRVTFIRATTTVDAQWRALLDHGEELRREVMRRLAERRGGGGA